MPETPATRLSGLTIVITRPVNQSAATADPLRAAGAQVLEFPVLDIAPVPVAATTLPAPLYAAIFVSANAVQFGAAIVRERARRLPQYFFAIGQATADALREMGFEHVVSPQQSSDSEGLIALRELQSDKVQGQHVVLVRGISRDGGRKVIEEALRARGATVTPIECYARRAASPTTEQHAALIAALTSPRKPAIMVLSVETLDHLQDALPDQLSLVKSAWLLVPHARVAAAARARGFVQVAEVPLSSAAMLAALETLKPRLTLASQTS